MLRYYTWASNSLLKVSLTDGVRSKYMNISQLKEIGNVGHEWIGNHFFIKNLMA